MDKFGILLFPYLLVSEVSDQEKPQICHRSDSLHCSFVRSVNNFYSIFFFFLQRAATTARPRFFLTPSRQRRQNLSRNSC